MNKFIFRDHPTQQGIAARFRFPVPAASSKFFGRKPPPPEGTFLSLHFREFKKYAFGLFYPLCFPFKRFADKLSTASMSPELF